MRKAKHSMSRFKLDPDKKVVHHIVYDYNGNSHKQKEITKLVYYAEHDIITRMQRRGKYISQGFIDHLKYFIWRCECLGLAINLDELDQKKRGIVSGPTEGEMYDIIKEVKDRRGENGGV